MSYENESNNYVPACRSFSEGRYFDDLKVNYTKSKVVQSNNYYAFGLQTSDSWTRMDTKPNQYLYNAGSELNSLTNNYEMFYRGYDPSIGRMSGVDIMVDKYASMTPYNYSMNDPVYYNDPSGAEYELASMGGCGCWRDEGPQDSGGTGGGMNSSSWYTDTYGGGIGTFGAGYTPGSYGGVGPNFGPDYYGDSYAVKNGQMSLQDYGLKHGTNYRNVRYSAIDYTTEDLNGELWTGASVIIGYKWIEISQVQTQNKISTDHERIMNNPLVQAMHRGQEEFASNPFGAVFLGLTSGGLAGGGGGSILKIFSKLAPTVQTTGRVFWSGGNLAKTSALEFAKANGMKTLEMTVTGKFLTKFTNITSYKFTKPLWDIASSSFAKGSLGPANVFHNAAGVSLKSTWRRIEYQILKGSEIIYHTVN